jgi:cytochrome c553
MTTRPFGVLALAAVGAFCGSQRLGADPPPKPDPAPHPADTHRVSVAAARDRAGLMHELFADTLDVVHHRYFRREGAVLPARAIEDVFERVDRRSGVKARWIAVNTPAMSINHEPATAFEKKAAEELAAGKAEFSRVEKGYLLRAAPIPLGAGCVGCHTRASPAADKTPRLAGLVIAIPVKDE